MAEETIRAMTDRGFGFMMIRSAIVALAVLTAAFSGIVPGVNAPPTIHGVVATTIRVGTSTNGPLGIPANPYPPATSMHNLYSLQPGHPAYVLAMTFRVEALAASPHGRYIALAEGEQGLWIVNSAGTSLHRLLPVPIRSTGQSHVAISAVAWSPDRYILAYAVNDTAGVSTDGRLGIWTVRYDGGSPRHLLAGARYAAVSLSWSSDGRTTLAAGLREGLVGIDAATGRTHVLVAGSIDRGSGPQYPAFAPAGVALAYVVRRFSPSGPTSDLYLIDAEGRRPRIIVQTRNDISAPVWAPDGRSIAYVWRSDVMAASGPPPDIHAVDLATGSAHVLVQGALTTYGYVTNFV